MGASARRSQGCPPKAEMADRILKRAAEGERDPVKLRMAALIGPCMMTPEELLLHAAESSAKREPRPS